LPGGESVMAKQSSTVSYEVTFEGVKWWWAWYILYGSRFVEQHRRKDDVQSKFLC